MDFSRRLASPFSSAVIQLTPSQLRLIFGMKNGLTPELAFGKAEAYKGRSLAVPPLLVGRLPGLR